VNDVISSFDIPEGFATLPQTIVCSEYESATSICAGRLAMADSLTKGAALSLNLEEIENIPSTSMSHDSGRPEEIIQHDVSCAVSSLYIRGGSSTFGSLALTSVGSDQARPTLRRDVRLPRT
jgi:hypothetical protein